MKYNYINTWIVLLLKLQVLALGILIILINYINYITKNITFILLIIFWYYLLAPAVNLWKQTHLKR